jgi:putative aldouronate transport system substrate-binding protein
MKGSCGKRLAALLALLLAAGMLLSGCADKGTDAPAASASDGGVKEADASTTYTYWLYQGEDTSYYPDYSQNPGVAYQLSKQTFGPENKKVALEFMVPVKGSEADNFNTLLSTGEYADILDLAVYTGSVVELYQDGVILDLTDYIGQHMPNYKKLLEENPDLSRIAGNLVNGEKKYLQIYNYGQVPSMMWGGFQYRRDWIVKYGTNPQTGAAFTGAYTGSNADGSVDKTSWEDDVVFPSGGGTPIYISDWEWMFEIFTRAMEAEGVTDGYCMSLYFRGYNGTGDLFCAFGGGGPIWYLDKDGAIKFGAATEQMRSYAQCLYAWYQNGWIDKAFPEHAADIFYRIDDTKVRQGKVGLWYGVWSQLEGNMDTSEGFAKGIVSFAAPQPINDKYGAPETQNVTPYTMYQLARGGSTVAISSKAAEKDLPTLLSWLDYQYSDEGAMLHILGLSKEQFEETQDPLYIREGLTEGAYYAFEKDGQIKHSYVDKVAFDTGNLSNAVRNVRLVGYDLGTLVQRGSESLLKNYDQWLVYENTGWLQSSFTRQLSPEDAKVYSKTNTNVEEFLSKNLPPFIKGAKDPYNDEDWNAFMKALSKYSPDKVTALYQALLDSLNQ